MLWVTGGPPVLWSKNENGWLGPSGNQPHWGHRSAKTPPPATEQAHWGQFLDGNGRGYLLASSTLTSAPLSAFAPLIFQLYFFENFSTRPALSMNYIVPVKTG